MAAHDPAGGQVGPSFSLILPTYNAASFLGQTWQRVRQFLSNTAREWEVLFVCDGCTDGSPEMLAERTAAAAGLVRVLQHAPNRGKGYAVRRGLAEARGRWRIFTDVDLAYGFDAIVNLASALRGGAEVAIASRTHRESRLIVPPRLQGYAFRRHLQGLVFSSLVRKLLPLTQRDTQAGLKGLSARAVDRLIPHLRCDGFGFDCELLTVCHHLGMPVVEMPISFRLESRASTVKVGHLWQTWRELWAIRHTWGAVPDPSPEPAWHAQPEALA